MTVTETEDFLAHYGVKGMKWGIRKEDPPATKNAPKSALTKSENFRLLKTATVTVDKHVSDEPGQGLSPQKKKALIYGITGAVVVAGIVGATYYGKKNGVSLPGPGLMAYKNSYNQSRLNAIKGNFITPESYKREAFTLPAGHTFYRLSSGKETGFRSNTYASPSEEDFNRYVSQLGRSLNTRITFKAKTEIKVPSLDETLDALRVSMGSSATASDALSRYRSIVGGDWDAEQSGGLFRELAKRGYSAIVDEMDAGVVSERPLVIFNSDNFSEKRSSSMNFSEILRRENSVLDFADRK